MKEHDERVDLVRELLSSGHAHLDELFDQLVARVRMDDPERIRESFCRFEHELETHMRAEETQLLPTFALQASFEAACIRKEHQSIRAQLEQLGIDLDLHALRAERVEEFVRTLREHAAREERMLYPWADANLTQPQKTSLLSRLNAGERHHHNQQDLPRAAGQR